MGSLNQEQRLVLSAALAAAWSDRELHASEERWIRLLAELIEVEDADLDVFLRDRRQMQAALNEPVDRKMALRVLSAASDVVAADRQILPDEADFLRRLGKHLKLPKQAIERNLTSLHELEARLPPKDVH